MFHSVLLTSLRTESHQQNVVTARLCIWIVDLFDRHTTSKISRRIASDCLDVGVGEHMMFLTHQCPVIPPELPLSGCFVLTLCGWSEVLLCHFQSTELKMIREAENFLFCSSSSRGNQVKELQE